ncbi:hypothetical protein LINPERHAP2_LOCUS20701 [Linum perenne]
MKLALLDKSLRKRIEKLNDEIEKTKWMEMELLLMKDLPSIDDEYVNDDAKEKLNYMRDILREMIKTATERTEKI